MIKDLVSVVMPTYNDEKYLPSAIDDILAQSYSNFELIIVDDGSTDSSPTILEKYAKRDKRIKLFRKENGGTGSALNLGFEHAIGEFGTWVSSDDNKTENFLERLVGFLKKNRDVEYVNAVSDSQFLNSPFKPYEFHEDGTRQVHLDGLSHNKKLSNIETVVDDWAHVNSFQCFLGVCFMFTMKLKERVGEYLEIPGEDYEMCMRMALNSRVGYIDSVLGSHNNPDDSLSMQDRNCVMEANRKVGELYSKTNHWNPKIPKVASFYWGSSKMSFLRYMTILSFKKFNPDWSIHLYIPENVSDKISWSLEGDQHHQCDQRDYKADGDYFEKLLSDVPLKLIKVDFSKTFIGADASEPHKSDLLGWKVLSSTGGLWIDMDIVFYKPVTSFEIQNSVDTIVCYDERNPHYDGSPAAPIGLMGSSGSNFFFKKILLASKEIYFNGVDYQTIGCLAKKDVANDFNIAKTLFYKNTFHNIGGELVYAIDHNNLEKLWEANHFDMIADSGIGIHWYGGAPISQKWNNILTHENWREFDSTVIEAFKKVYNEE
tara:strand:- start:658 stop:2289 length:1632 start_codon:yes stop_codon:yes gene_type:complete